MNLNSSLFDRVRIRDQHAREGRAGEHTCQHPGCTLAGPHRAPMGRDREGQYFFFCLGHVQEYNKSYNYFSGMTDEAVARFQKDAVTGHRPTWKLGARDAGRGEGQSDAMGDFGEAARARGAAGRPEEPRQRFGHLALKALDTLDIAPEEATKEAIRARYKRWVKQLHPDANGGDRSREEKLREIIRAYNTLKTAGHA
jgi:curved DNA-binding protein CbpA